MTSVAGLQNWDRDRLLLWISLCNILIIPSDLHRRGHYKMRRGVCLSVCLSLSVSLPASPSVCRVPRPNWKTEWPRKSKIGRMETHHASNLWTYLEVKRSTSPAPINAVTEVFRMGRPTKFTLGTLTDKRRNLQVQSKVKVARLRGTSDSREQNISEIPKLIGRLLPYGQ